MPRSQRQTFYRERQVCRVLKQWRGTQHYLPMHRTDEGALARDHRTGQRVWPLRLPANHRAVASPRLAGWQGPYAGRLALRGVESAGKTRVPGTVVFERRVVHPTAARASEPGVELRICQRVDPRWKKDSDVDATMSPMYQAAQPVPERSFTERS
jgi:hypothetical protein